MIEYQRIAQKIHDWLASLQVNQELLKAEVRDGNLHFTLEHPVKRDLKIAAPLPPDRLFQTQGLVIELVDKRAAEATLRVYDFGGIWDPVDERVMGEHYSASHFALLSAILYEQTGERQYLDHATKAFQFHQHTSPDEYALSQWMYHWDFQNYALIECYRRLEQHLEREMKESWAHCLQNWKTNQNNHLANWAAMRALAYLQRYRLFGSRFDWVMSKYNYFAALRGEQPDGGFDDEHNVSRPIQYHIYTVALLHRLYLLNPSPKLAQKFLRGVDFFLPFIDPDGDFNYWGRGHAQIFGFGTAIYALTAAAHLTGLVKYQEAAQRVFGYLITFLDHEHFTLVLNTHADRERMGWYDYHHTTVYNAFLGVWLALAYELTRQPRAEAIAIRPYRQKKSRNFVFLSNHNFFVAFGKGLPHYSSETGLSPCHLWIRDAGWVFSCPGGATASSFGQRFGDANVQKNLFAPIFVDNEDNLFSPVGCRDTIASHSESEAHISTDLGICTIDRRINLSDDALEVRDTIVFKRNDKLREVRFFNFPVLVDKFAYELNEGQLWLRCRDSRPGLICEVEENVIALEAVERIRTAKGVAEVVAARLVDREVKAGATYKVTTTFFRDLKQLASGRRSRAAEVVSL
ncbi:MAG TPA: hypothetical protein VGA99_16170 [bacterium]